MFAPFLFFFFFLFFFESSTFTRNGAPSCFVAAAGGCGSSSLCDCFPPIVSIVLSDSPSFFPLSPPVSHTILSPHSLLFPLHHHLWYLPFSSLFLSLSLLALLPASSRTAGSMHVLLSCSRHTPRALFLSAPRTIRNSLLLDFE